jgi:Swt1-like HEPN
MQHNSVRLLTVKASSFDFSYLPNDIYDCLKETEISLRNLISKVMDKRYGSQWLQDSTKGFTQEELAAILERKNESGPNLSSNNLLDYTFIIDLKGLIEKNWDNFSMIFDNREKFFMYMDELNTCRKSVAHFRDIPLNKKYLYLGICGEILLWIHNWLIGYNYKIKGYVAEFRFQIKSTANEAAGEIQAMKLAQNWIEIVESNSTITEAFKANSKFLGRLAKLVRFLDGHLTITQPIASPNYYGYVSSVSIYTENKDVLDRVMTNAKHPYWCLNWVLDQKLDRDGDDKQVAFVNNHGPIRIILGQFSQSNSQVGLICDGENSFLSAHQIFNPSLILSMYDGRMDNGEFSYLIHQSFSQDNS